MSKIIYRLILLCLCALGASIGMQGQIISNTEHRVGDGVLRTLELVQLPESRLGSFDTDSARVAMEEASKELRSYVFAQPISADVDIITSGKHNIWSDGTEVWQYRIRSRGALSLGLFFSEFKIPQGAYLYIYSTARPEHFIGGFGYENNNTHNSLPIQPIASDDIIIELQAPKGSHPTLKLKEVYHGVRPVSLLRLSQPQYGSPKAFECTPELACYPEYIKAGQSVVVCLMGGRALGTGTLVNNTKNDGRPLILTASHVVSINFSTQDIERQAERAIYFFNYQTPMCDSSIQPPVTQSIAGSTLLGYHSYTDFALLELSSVPPMAYQPSYAGWSATPMLNASHFNIHHPTGFTKRINISFSPLSYISYPSTGLPFGANQHLKVQSWDIGTTAAGSSGSPLYDVEQRLVGVLSGGDSYCSRKASDYFASLERLWENHDPEARKIVTALDPIGKGESKSCKMRSGGNGSDIVPQRITHLSIKPGDEPLYKKIPQIDRSVLLGTAEGVEEIGESYRLMAGTKIYGVYITLTGVARIGEKLSLKIYGKEGNILLASEQISLDPLDLQNYHDEGNGGFSVLPKIEDPVTDEARQKFVQNRFQEVYLALLNPISISEEQTIYFSVSSVSIPAEASIAHQQFDSPDFNSAIWKIGNSWKPTDIKGGIALWIDPVVSHPTMENKEGQKPQFSLTPLPNGHIKLSLIGVDLKANKRLDVYTLQGQRLMQINFSGNTTLLDRSYLEGVGIVVIHIETEGWNESIKAYFPKSK